MTLSCTASQKVQAFLPVGPWPTEPEIKLYHQQFGPIYFQTSCLKKSTKLNHFQSVSLWHVAPVAGDGEGNPGALASASR
jgi:hypothetical protein